MKKIFTLSLAFLYLLVSSGLLVEIHHCMGRIADADVHFFGHQEEKTTCGTCGMPSTDEFSHCCKDEIKFVKVADDQKAGNILYLQDAPLIMLGGNSWPSLYTPVFSEPEAIHPKANAPPLTGPSTQALFCIFRI